ncbi:phosphoenolpyruvate--protein phosphotransferase [Vibrio gazogenes]|uniref:phosphoenolpyruvate--protein phosphotransferase n=1 Tax=Vibrio gazogenes DSM 21264 = NBRC 103151 TaxID=1123492 RepID=A0A1M5E6F0_VIBGA|nr:phosphoenolpyruvate--protein phosphotransferase [Vibrio gazogenes]USP14322.1 phosphoenolpyruvate--protein phosphotransferase [Vibrio gazogenes]SHF74766.1 phosphotransferase system, enzyme I, PtsP [Vibrio gazogenes DSM 21264] [Vibrio gazogenes DSM 21264 = NBRC 103151]
MLSQLRDIMEQVSKVEDVHQAFDILVQQTCEAMNTECCTIYLANEEKLRLELIATQGLKFKGNKIHIGFDEGLVGLVKRSAEPINLAEASKHPDFKYFRQLGEEVYQSFLGAPIIYRKQVLGVLVVQQRSPRQFSEIEESFMVTLSAQLAVLVAHAQSQGLWSLAKQQPVVRGIGVSPGVAIGEFWWDNSQPELENVLPASTLDVKKEQEWLSRAVEKALSDFRRMRKKLDGDIHKETLAIFDLFTHLLNDPMLRKDLKEQILKGDRADWALRQVVEAYVERFSQMSDVYLRERAQDVRELGQRMLYFLYNSEQDELTLEKPIILVVRELTASILASIPKDKLLAVVSLEGAANSHAAILSRALGIPAIMGVSLNFKEINNQLAIVDGYSGFIHISPDSEVLAEYQELMEEEGELSEMVNQSLAEKAITSDGYPVNILLNAGLNTENNTAVNQGVDGVGLYRTEISFLLQNRFPSEEEQIQIYRQVLCSHPDKMVVMRTLDVGGDKPLPYLPIEEDNPFLGWRGIRFTLDHPDIFLIQLRAMLKASIETSNLGILLPMISGMKELDDALAFIEQAFMEVSAVDERVKMPAIGIMLEVPSMIYLLPQMADRVDFISVGTNDLTQYLLAVDRNNARVADVYESMHPSVLMALKHISDVCHQHQINVCVCGELAGDPIGALLLIGMGYQTLSMNTANVAKVKYLIRHSEVKTLKKLASQALMQTYGHDIYSMMRTYFEEFGFAGFIRAGKH